jgi:glycosyltransferase involved in cell wall biosynthesis
LQDSGHEVFVYTSNANGNELLQVPLGTVVEHDTVKVLYFPLWGPTRLNFSPSLIAALNRKISAFDLIHINGVYSLTGTLIAKIAVAKTVPFVLSPRGMLFPEFIVGGSRWLKKLWLSTVERTTLDYARRIHVTSIEEQKGFEKSINSKVRVSVIANGVALDDIQISDSLSERIWRGVPRGSRVVFLGRIDWTKGVDLAIQATKNIESAVLLVAGHDQIGLERRLHRERDGRYLDRVKFVGSVDGIQKWSLLAGADVMIAPSLKESFGLSVAEALSIGLPVICSEGVGLSTVIARVAPECVVQRSTEKLTEALKILLNNRIRRLEIGEQLRIIIRKEYSWGAIVSEMESLYRGAIEESLA